jgi:hypothetical protein
MPIILLLFGMFAISLAISSGPVPPFHYEHNYSAEQVRAMEKLVGEVASGEPDGSPVILYREPKPQAKKIYHPKTERDRLAMISRVWGLQDGNFEIGSLK